MTTLSNKVTIADVLHTLAQPEEYVRGVLANVFRSELDRDRLVVRIGVTGEGLWPNYKFDYIDTDNTFELEFEETFEIYNGRSHEQITHFGPDDIKGMNWSLNHLGFADVQALLGALREARKKR